MSAALKLLDTAVSYRELLKSQYWDADRLHLCVSQRMDSMLASAARIPFYTSRFGEAPRSGEFAKLPILTRPDIPELCTSVRSLHPPGTKFVSDASSGSTGWPCAYLFDRRHQRGRFGARARYLRAHGWSPLKRTAWIVAVTRDKSPDEDFVKTRLLPLANFKSTTVSVEEQTEWVVKIDPLYLHAYPSVLEGMLELLGRRRWALPSLRRIFTSSESLGEGLRESVKRQLGVDIADCYGSTEAFLAWECERGRYHINAEHVLIEVVDEDNRPVAPGTMGRVLITTLENHLMPLVRYEIGDYAFAEKGSCECGRGLPLIGKVAGRGMNLLRTPDGALLSPFALTVKLKTVASYKQFQIVQKSIDLYLVRYVADRELPPLDQQSIRQIFCEAVGGRVQVSFERVSEIARTPSGKSMVAISELAANEIQRSDCG